MEKSVEKDIWWKLGHISTSVCALVSIIFLVTPLIYPMVLPAPISTPARDFYDEVQGLPDDSTVVYTSQIGPGAWDEERDAEIATTKLLFRRPFKVVFWSETVSNVPLFTQVLEKANPEKYGKIYGEDYVYLGYIAGEESAIAAFAEDTWSAVSVDHYSKPLSDIPMMQTIKNYEDFDIWIVFTGCITCHERHVRQLTTPYGTSLLAGTPTSNELGLVPYWPKVIKGYLSGVMGGSSLEVLMGEPGEGSKINNAKSLGFIPTVIFLILGNIAFYGGKYFRKREEKG